MLLGKYALFSFGLCSVYIYVVQEYKKNSRVVLSENLRQKKKKRKNKIKRSRGPPTSLFQNNFFSPVFSPSNKRVELDFLLFYFIFFFARNIFISYFFFSSFFGMGGVWNHIHPSLKIVIDSLVRQSY